MHNLSLGIFNQVNHSAPEGSERDKAHNLYGRYLTSECSGGVQLLRKLTETECVLPKSTLRDSNDRFDLTDHLFFTENH